MYVIRSADRITPRQNSSLTTSPRWSISSNALNTKVGDSTGIAANDVVSAIAFTPGTSATGYDFADYKPVTIGGVVFAGFSRGDETQADEQAVRNVILAKIDPKGVPEMFRILLDERKTSPTSVDAFFATHPLEETRIAFTTAEIARHSADELRGAVRDTPDFQAFKRRLAALPPSPAPKKP